MRKLAGLIIVVFVVQAFLVGCGSQSGTTDETKQPAPAKPNPTGEGGKSAGGVASPDVKAD